MLILNVVCREMILNIVCCVDTKRCLSVARCVRRARVQHYTAGPRRAGRGLRNQGPAGLLAR